MKSMKNLFLNRKFSVFSAVIFVFFAASCSKPGDLTVQRAMKAYSSQNYDEALSLFNQALGEETNYHPESIYSFISNLYVSLDDLENAVVYAEKSLALRPDYRGFVTLGMNYHLLEDDEKAEFNYRKAIDLNPQKGEAYASLGAMYIGQEKYELAVENLEKAAEFEPKIAVIHANLAVAYAAVGKMDESEKEFQKAADFKCKDLDEFKIRAEQFSN